MVVAFYQSRLLTNPSLQKVSAFSQMMRMLYLLYSHPSLLLQANQCDKVCRVGCHFTFPQPPDTERFKVKYLIMRQLSGVRNFFTRKLKNLRRFFLPLQSIFGNTKTDR